MHWHTHPFAPKHTHQLKCIPRRCEISDKTKMDKLSFRATTYHIYISVLTDRLAKQQGKPEVLVGIFSIQVYWQLCCLISGTNLYNCKIQYQRLWNNPANATIISNAGRKEWLDATSSGISKSSYCILCQFPFVKSMWFFFCCFRLYDALECRTTYDVRWCNGRTH